MTTVLVAGAGGSAGANVVDSLRRAPRSYRIVGSDASPLRLHLSAADRRVVVPLASDSGYTAALRRLVAAEGIDVVLPQPDPEVLVIGALRDELGARTLLPRQEALEVASDKDALNRRLAEAGVAVPESRPVVDLATLAELVADLLTRHERLWLRARRGAGSRAALPIRSVDQALGWVRWWMEERGLPPADFMVSEFLPGREFAYQSLWQEGDLVAGQLRERLEYLYGHLTPSGQTSTPAVARTVREPQVDDLACAAILALDARPTGVYCVDIKEDASARPRVTEINAGRFFTTSNFLSAAGLNMPDLLVRCALGERPPRLASSPVEPDLYWIRMVDMGYVLVAGNDLDPWSRPDR